MSPSPKALHSAHNPSWGTPEFLLTRARDCLGGSLDLDPCSSPKHNERVRATRFYDEADDGLTRPWRGRVLVNPPGRKVRQFWTKLLGEVQAAAVTNEPLSAIWVGFSLAQLAWLQEPLEYPTCILRKRVAFVREDGQVGHSPSHHNYVTAIGIAPTAFQRAFGALGVITWTASCEGT